VLDQDAVPKVQVLDPAGADDLEEETAAAPGDLDDGAPARPVGPGADLNGAAIHAQTIE
jgi:hypothetical protein